MLNKIESLGNLNIEELLPSETVLVVVDLINGFVREGMLKSQRVENIINPIVNLIDECEKRKIAIVAFADCHGDSAAEFEAFPKHCLCGSFESELVEEIKDKDIYLIEKNSTNGFLEEKFQKFLKKNPHIKNFIVVGDCTDLCVLQFVLTLKCSFNSQNIKSRIIVPADCVETYELNEHAGDLMNVVSLQMMAWNGIEIVKKSS